MPVMPPHLKTDDPATLAELAGLVYVEDRSTGIVRRRRGSGFSYEHLNGRSVGVERRNWIESLAIPPAWSDVWISAAELGHILATGTDEAGRTQYLYHPDWRTARDVWKFERLAWFPTALDRIRRQVTIDMDDDTPEIWVPAAAVRLIDLAALRVGHDEETDARGATTLHIDDIVLESSHIRLAFTAKGGIEQNVVIEDEALIERMEELSSMGTKTLFSYEKADGSNGTIDADGVNAYIRQVGRKPFSAKDFRTWWGTVAAAEHLLAAGDDPAVLEAIDAAADFLGNTRAVARSSYVAPAVIQAAESGLLQEIHSGTRSGARLTRVERTVGRVLNQSFIG